MTLALTPIVQQLRGAGFRQVEGVLEFARLDVLPRNLPALYVVPIVESAGANTRDQGRDQIVDFAFAVQLVVEGARRNADGIAEDIKADGDRIIDALVGWTHPAASRACSFVRAQLGSASGPAVFWDMRFTTRYHLRKAS